MRFCSEPPREQPEKSLKIILGVKVGLGTISAQEAQLEKAFTAISKLKGFKTYYNEQQLINGWGADNHLDCFSEVKTTCANADLQEQLLSILETIPKELLKNDMRAVSDDQKKKYLDVRISVH